jgi:pimeloyl-ACP methyl ester carboxylesterase
VRAGNGWRGRAAVIATAFLLTAGWGHGARAADDLKAMVEKLGGKECEDSSLACVDLVVPVDRAKPGSNQTITVRFAVSFASAESKGILFYAVGGPGGSGLQAADSYLGSFDARLTEEMDVVFFDQRGVGPLNGIQCPKAGLAFDMAALSLERPEETIGAARTFVRDCLLETPHADLLPYIATETAIQDLEDFRAAIGNPKVWFYGESYGTQFAQAYATRYPGALNGLILDGVVDLTLDAVGYYGEDGRTVEKLLAKTLAECDADAECRADMGRPAAEVYDGLAAKLKAGSIPVDFPLSDGSVAKREMTSAILVSNSFYALYGPDSRVAFLRVLAASARDNFVPMLKLGYSNLSADPETLEPLDDPSWYGGAYYGITCPDYDDAGRDPEARAREIIDQARKLEPEAPRLIRAAYAERLACAFWPSKAPDPRPAAFAGGDYPTLVLNADGDPATPVTNGYAVFDHAKNATMITMQGGPHVIWGRGLGCPDEIVFGLMLDGRKPEKREQVCKQDFVDAYIPLTAGKVGDAFGLAEGIEIELLHSPDLAGWDGYDPLTFGCDFGGTLTATAAQSGIEYTFENCAWWPGLKVSGDGVAIDAGDGTRPDGLTLDLEIAGTHRGALVYRHDTTTEAQSLSGEYDGKAVSTPRPLP